MKRLNFTIAFLLALLSSCAPATQPATWTPPITVTEPLATQTAPPPTATFTPAFSPTPDLYYPYTNEYLRSRFYGGGQVEFLEVLSQNIFFTKYLIRYPSDGLLIYGFAKALVHERFDKRGMSM